MTPTTERLQLLLVEDDDVDLHSFQRAVSKHSQLHLSAIARNGKEALAILCQYLEEEQRLPDLIVSDLHMPMMGGLVFLERLRNTPKLRSLPVVILSSSQDPGNVEAAYAHHVAGYFIKPISPQKLQQITQAIASYWILCMTP